MGNPRKPIYLFQIDIYTSCISEIIENKHAGYFIYKHVSKVRVIGLGLFSHVMILKGCHALKNFVAFEKIGLNFPNLLTEAFLCNKVAEILSFLKFMIHRKFVLF